MSPLASCWTSEDIELLNPKDAKQDASFLEHLYRTGAATAVDLCNGSDLLENQSGPYVLAFGQLPFELAVPTEPFRVQGWRQGVTVELRFTRASTRLDVFGVTVRDGAMLEEDSGPDIPQLDGRFTQVTGLVKLWTRRAQLHKSYVNCLTPKGLRNDVIGRVGDWMDAPEAKLPLPARRYAPLTAQAYQAEVARRVRTEFLRAIHSFAQAYSVANLESIPNINTLFGYFLLIAPGRVACASTPIPIVAGLAASYQNSSEPGPSAAELRSLIGKPLPEDDSVVRQLMAMHRLLIDGEPELALIGSITAVEWFLNRYLSKRLRQSTKRKSGSFSIREMMSAEALNFLPSETKDKLRSLAELRNSYVHGAPPARPMKHKSRGVVSSENSTLDHSREALFLSLEVYRCSNLAFASPNDA